jgi:DNA-binding MarR family transcriptional regulator
MNNKENQEDDYRSLQLLDEISRNNELTQRDLSKNLGIALGLINSYIKNLVSRGYITVSAIPKNRYKYYLTPKGFREKTRLTYEHLRNFTNLYRVARKDFLQLFNAIEKSGIKKITFCGIDEVTEIAYLSLKEVELELVGVVDDIKKGERFFDYTVSPIEEATSIESELNVLTSFNRGGEITEALIKCGIIEDRICDISKGGWLKKIEKKGME